MPRPLVAVSICTKVVGKKIAEFRDTRSDLKAASQLRKLL